MTELLADSDAREIQKQVVQKAINTDVSMGGDVRIVNIDYKAFEKTDEERGRLLTLRRQWKEGMKARWGDAWRKHMNYE